MATAANQYDSDSLEERTKPPFLRPVRIRGYKSIAFCEVQLQPLTILVGRNGTGKSNFLDALAFLRDAMDTSVTEAARLHGGTGAIRCRATDAQAIEIGIEATFLSYQMKCQAEYAIKLLVKGRGLVEVERERLRIHDTTGSGACGFDASQGKAQWVGLEQFGHGHSQRSKDQATEALDPGTPPYPRLFDSYRPDRLLLGLIGSQPFIDLGEGLRAMRFYNFNPEEIRKLHKPAPGRYLDKDGSNLASVVETTREISPEAVQWVQDYLSVITPEIQSFGPVPYGEYETVGFRQRNGPSAGALEFDAASMSDGTLRVLGALVAAFQIVLPYGQPAVIGIEEPETALHPAEAHALVSALDAATEHTQVLLTTHSGDLLADPKLPLSSVLVVRMREGRTEIAPVDPASREIIRQELYSLADLQRAGQLNLDEEYLERQAATRLSVKDW